MGDEVLARRARAEPVMLEPAPQFARRERRGLQCAEQLRGVFGVGARQRRQHPGGRPRGDDTAAHGGEQRVGQTAQQLQAAADPADVAPAEAGDFVLAEPLAVHQFAQQQRFLEHRQRSSLGARQHRQQGLRELTRPRLDAGGVAPQAAQRRHTPIAVDQHQAFVAVRHRDARNELAATLDRGGQTFDRPWLGQPHRRKAQVQAVQVDLSGGGGIHGRDGSSPGRV
jgi:hypothetical protein